MILSIKWCDESGSGGYQRPGPGLAPLEAEWVSVANPGLGMEAADCYWSLASNKLPPALSSVIIARHRVASDINLVEWENNNMFK